MAKLDWNEVQQRAAQFATVWKDTTYEKGESQSFWSDFLSVFGVDRKRQGALFEYATKKLDGSRGFIDLFWPGVFVAEHKSAGRDLDNAEKQAGEYVLALPEHDLPRAICVSDFQTFRLYNLETRNRIDFALADLPKHVRAFAFLVGETSRTLAEEDPVNRHAAEKMAELHNRLAASRYTGHDLELLLVRLVFCLFADDASIFVRGTFADYLRTRTGVDGTDLGPRLVQLFEVLNTPVEHRQTTLDADLAAFPYINGGLFERPLRTPNFDSTMRLHLLQATELDWSKVSPAIFGSMFQGVMDEKQRRNLGAHYTSERNILRLIKPLFLDDLYEEFDRVRHNRNQLETFHEKLASLNFLDPACGCGNFLVITYRELRRLEHKVVQILLGGKQALDLHDHLKVDVDQMHGIEIEEFPAMIAQTALWLTDHQMNVEASQMLGQTFTRLPLTASANIANVNALTTDWADVVPPEKLNYILGNPPFIGKKEQTTEQKALLRSVFQDVSNASKLDFVSCWFRRSVEYMVVKPSIQTALVGTNSITQGEQVSILWKWMLATGVEINFAHRTFRWNNEGRDVAAVHCVILGFGLEATSTKRIYEYPDIRENPIEHQAQEINPYLVDAPNVIVGSRARPLEAQAPAMRYGSMPIDDGHLILSILDRDVLVKSCPESIDMIRRYIGGDEFINSIQRYCLWLVDIAPERIRSCKLVAARVAQTRDFRLQSGRDQTVRAADWPFLFGEIRQPTSSYLVLPKVSSENRDYLPIGFVDESVVASGSMLIVPAATLFTFGTLQSSIHMSWMRAVCGRLESRYQYSASIVYNNFPWPDDVSDADRDRIERLAQGVLDARAMFPQSTLADLYDPNTMPQPLVKAHRDLDRAVDRLYRKEGFTSDLDRVEHLFRRYQELTGN